MKVLFGKPPVRQINAPLTIMTYKDIFKIITKDNELKSITNKIRSEKDLIERKKMKAQLLPYILPFNYSELVRNQSNFIDTSFAAFECDHVDNTEELRKTIVQNRHIVLFYKSISGDGFKFIIKFNEPVTKEYYVRVYNVLRLMFNKEFNITLDPSSKDMARVQFLSHDKLAYYNEKAESVDVKQIIKHLKIIDSAENTNIKESVIYDHKDIVKAIKYIRDHGYLDSKDEQTWWELSMSIASLGEAGREYFLMLSKDHPLYPEDTVESLNKTYNKFLKMWGNYHDESRILNMNAFFNKIEKLYGFKLNKKNKTGKKSLELLLADKFTAKYKDVLLFDHSKIGKGKSYGWYYWDNTHYVLGRKGEISQYYLKFIEEEKQKAIERAKKEVDSDSDKNQDKESVLPENIPVNAGDGDVLSIAQIAKAETRRYRDLTLNWASEREGLGVLPDELDNDLELFNVLNGVINLRSGKLLKHSPSFKITKIAPVVYEKNTKAHNWENFILKISFNNTDMARYIQEAVGYSLTGHTSEQAMFFLYGIGANGKSTFLEALKLIFGDYCIHANYETFTSMARDGSNHSEDVVRLKGSRLVISTEINSNKTINESVIKQITSGDTITARDLHSSSIEFTPTFKLWIAGNHKPKIQNFDYGIRRRIYIIPFEYIFNENEMRPQFEVLEEFKAERSGILNWALEGARRWFKNKRLIVPDIVQDTTRKYFMENNMIEQFISDMLIVYSKDSPEYDNYIEAKTLYTAYLEYCNSSNEEKLGRNQFYNRMEELGYKKEINKKTTYLSFKGIGFKNKKSPDKKESYKNLVV